MSLPTARTQMSDTVEHTRWYVLRDLKRRNAARLAWHELGDAGIEVFTPMTEVLMNVGGKQQRRRLPVIQDLLFARADKTTLDRYVDRLPNLQYRYRRGHSIDDPMTVRDDEMERFIRATQATDTPEYYRPGEITPEMLGRRIRIIGGPVDGLEGSLLSLRGSRRKRILIEVPELLAVAVEVSPEFIRML